MLPMIEELKDSTTNPVGAQASTAIKITSLVLDIECMACYASSHANNHLDN